VIGFKGQDRIIDEPDHGTQEAMTFDREHLRD